MLLFCMICTNRTKCVPLSENYDKMNRRIILAGILGLMMCNVLMAAPSVTKLVMSMERLQRNGHWLEAMDTAVYVLTLDAGNRLAANFMYRNWDNMMQKTNRLLGTLTDEENIGQAEQRCEIYRLLDEIQLHISEVEMPLYGPNGRWVWQPEISYYAGHYDAERTRTLRLLLRKADEALRSYDADAAREYYMLALSKYLVAEGEQQSNLATMLEQCNSRIESYAASQRINDALFAWELSNLSLSLDPSQENIRQQQILMQQHIADLYLRQAQQAEAIGDTLQAKEFRFSADDWQPLNP